MLMIDTRISESSWLVAANFQWPRWSAEGDEDVLSFVRRYKDLNFSTVIVEELNGIVGIKLNLTQLHFHSYTNSRPT